MNGDLDHYKYINSYKTFPSFRNYLISIKDMMPWLKDEINSAIQEHDATYKHLKK